MERGLQLAPGLVAEMMVLAAAVVACGGTASVEDGARADEQALPPLPGSCAVAIAAIDWLACEVEVEGLSRATAINCTHQVRGASCMTEAGAYWSCVADVAPACVVVEKTEFSVSTVVAAPECDDARGALAECLEVCGPRFVCQAEDWAACACSDGVAAAGEACGAYPSEDASLPACVDRCSPCS